MLRLIPAATFLFLFSACVAPGQSSAEGPDTRQIHWQRSLDDALSLCKATGRPLLVAVNMDGESASDRIVHENYRDPAFVASTRRCVCLGASVFRHNARDHDDEGRRIPCPRLGEITCGEHMALEPVLFAKYLADGERVAPRHALILPDGRKAFDISLSFDLQDIDQALASAVAAFQPLPSGDGAGDWAALARRRDARGRALFEAALVRVQDDATLDAATKAIETNGDRGSLDALRILAARALELSVPQRSYLDQAAGRLGLSQEWFDALLAMAGSLGGVTGDPGPDAQQLRLLGSLARGHREATVAQRSFLLARCALGMESTSSASSVLGGGWDCLGSRYAEVTNPHGGPVSLRVLVQTANAVTRSETGLPKQGGPADELREASVIQRELEDLDNEPNVGRTEPEWQGRFAKASLDLGRRHMETGQRDTQLLLEDAAQHFAKALVQRPDRYDWWIERARTAWFLGRFAEQVEYGRAALRALRGKDQLPADVDLLGSPLFQDARSIEALRWIGDGHARLLGERAGKDPAVELCGMIDGLRALGIAAASAFGHEKDWLSFASFCGAVGLRREQQAILQCGATRLPAARELRQALNAALWQCGRLELAPVIAEAIAAQHAPSADAYWFAGYAWILAAEDARRCERPRTAIADYHAGEAWFSRSAELKPEYQDSCRAMQALARVGEAMAETQVDRRNAVTCLTNARLLQADLSQVKDGLGYDVFDLLDKILEWRPVARSTTAPAHEWQAGGSDTVTPLALLDELDQLVPADPFWAAAVSDSALREALRADGRNPERKQRETVDAAGKRIMMLMGVPNEEGDRWLRAAIEAGRRAATRANNDADQLPLAQAQTIWAERMLERGRTDGAHEALVEAAGIMKVDPPAAGVDVAALTAVAAKLRSLLGEARPRLREGR